jgi:hypothetical protein
VAILVRHRADTYSLDGRLANLDIVQVADRFHLMCNVSGALKELSHTHRWHRLEAAMEPLPDASAT